ncbi:uncharacterized protein Gm39572 [Mus musculus]|uniref:uncharacterized protein Gm39572 n=1 Tax=Mus musculus TaxID=10090 RepID=UPI0011AE556F|nr:uncharacterized protein Gm39572 [Mus musculus]
MKARGRLAACSRSLPAPHPACSVWFHGPGFPHSWRGRLAKPRVDGATGGALQPAVVTALLSPPCLPFKAMKCHPWGRQDPNKAPAWLLGHELWAEAGSERHRQSKPDGSFWPAPSREAAWPCSGSQCAHGFLLRLGDLPKSSRGLQLAQHFLCVRAIEDVLIIAVPRRLALVCPLTSAPVTPGQGPWLSCTCQEKSCRHLDKTSVVSTLTHRPESHSLPGRTRAGQTVQVTDTAALRFSTQMLLWHTGCPRVIDLWLEVIFQRIWFGIFSQEPLRTRKNGQQGRGGGAQLAKCSVCIVQALAPV